MTFTKAPKHKTTKRKAKFGFAADEPAAFVCRLDRKPAGNCSSPHKVKAGPGKHTFTVVATDAVGNKGEASARWKVKKKRGH